MEKAGIIDEVRAVIKRHREDEVPAKRSPPKRLPFDRQCWAHLQAQKYFRRIMAGPINLTGFRFGYVNFHYEDRPSYTCRKCERSSPVTTANVVLLRSSIIDKLGWPGVQNQLCLINTRVKWAVKNHQLMTIDGLNLRDADGLCDLCITELVRAFKRQYTK